TVIPHNSPAASASGSRRPARWPSNRRELFPCFFVLPAEPRRGEAGHGRGKPLLSFPASLRQYQLIVRGENPDMWRLLSGRCIWSALGAIVLKTLVSLLLVSFFPTVPHKRPSLFILSYPGISHSLW